MSQLSDRVRNMQPSVTVAANDKAKALRQQGIDLINLTAGEPDFDTPDFVKQAGIDAINNNYTRYAPVDGIPELKEAIRHKLLRDNQLEYADNQIIVSTGAKQSLYNLTQCLLNPGDEAIILAPYWVSYPAMTKLAGAKPVIISADIHQHYKITAEQLEQAITPKTKLLFINSPSNPSAAYYSKTELKALAEVLLKHPQVHIITDDIYEYILWSEEPFSNIVNACPELYERTSIVNGVSKAHCMTGWRIGFCASSAEISKAVKKIQSQSTTSATTIAQYAATAAFKAKKADFFQPMLSAYKQRQDYIVSALNELPGISAISGEGTFYTLLDASKLMHAKGIKDDLELTDHFLEKARVAMVPGSAFGAPGCLRLSFATSMDMLEEAMARLKQAIEN